MEDADQLAALLIFTVIGGAVGAGITKSNYWRGALSTALSVLIVGGLFLSIGSNSLGLSALGLLFAMVIIGSALRMRPLQIASTTIGAYAGLSLVQAYLFWTSASAA